jgi:copper homeostasis protein (lipoprotein)
MAARLLTVLAIALVLPSVLRAQPDVVTGTITYRERVALVGGAVAEVTLEDVSRADAPATIVGRVRLEPSGQVPLRFELPFDRNRIDPSHRYGVRARILEGDRPVFATTQATLVLTQGREDHVDLVLSRIAASKPAAAAAPATPPSPLPTPVRLAGLPATFTGILPCADCQGIRYQLNLFDDDSFVLRRTYAGRSTTPVDDLGSWALSSDRRVVILRGSGEPEYFAIRDNQSLRRLDTEGREIKSSQPYDLRRASGFQGIDLRATLRGAYRGAPDGATFTECASGQRWPVASEGASRDLETAFRDARRRPGDALIVSVDGRVTTRPRPDSPASEPALVVDRVAGVAANESCAARFITAPLEGTYWRLTRLGDIAVAAPSNPKTERALTFQPDERFSGSSGCNRLVGEYVRGLDTISLSAAGTMKACAAGTEDEAAFLSALKQVQTFRILGNTLELQDAQRKLVARFEARPRK